MLKNDSFLRREFFRMACTFCAESTTSIFLVVFVQYFVASGEVKGTVAAGTFLGFLVSPLLLPILRNVRLSTVHTLVALYVVAAVGYVIAALSAREWGVALGLVIGTAAASAGAPYSTALWRTNVPETLRGELFGKSLFVGYLARILFAGIAGEILQRGPAHYPYVAALLALLMVGAAIIVSGYKDLPMDEGGAEEFRLRDVPAVLLDKQFAFLLSIWMCFGAANLAVMPLRADFLGSGKEIPALDPRAILFLLEIVPSLIRILFVQFWGRVFDRLGFYRQRVLLNLLMAVGISLFFSVDPWLRAVGVVLWSLGHSGGTLMWNLWVTAFAPPGKTAAYMSIHTSCTGLRGCVSPMLAYAALEYIPARDIALLAALVIFGVTMLLVPGARREALEKGGKAA